MIELLPFGLLLLALIADRRADHRPRCAPFRDSAEPPTSPICLDGVRYVSPAHALTVNALVLDVRTTREFDEGHLEGSVHIPTDVLWKLLQEDGPGMPPKSEPILVVCAKAYRAACAADWLQRAGYTEVAVLAGGIQAWARAGLPVVHPGAPDPMPMDRLQDWLTKNVPMVAAMRVSWWLARQKLRAMLMERMAESIVEPKGRWRKFWQAAVKRLGVRGTAAATLMAADGPLVFGDLVAAGLTLWTIYDLVVLWYEIWAVVDGAEASTASP
jgi:rhodanese-related sulfurtransferase